MSVARSRPSHGFLALASTAALSADTVRAATAADTPYDLRVAYGLSGTTRTNYTGEGHTIAMYASSSAPY